MSLASAIAHFRAKQNSVMTETCTVTRGAGAPTVDPETLELTHPAGSTAYSGACLVRHVSNAEPDVADVPADSALYKVRFPANTDVREGDSVTVSASTYDTGLVGALLTVRSVRLDGWQISRNAICEQER